MAATPQGSTRPASPPGSSRPSPGRTAPAASGMMLPMRIWDLPIRLFHWALVVLVGLCWLSIEMNWMRVHMLAGQAVLVLLVFRLAWGIVGSDTARFAQFLRSPLAGIRHLLHFTRREPDTTIGHNEAGGWMVVVMLLVLLGQVMAGLFANNEDSFVEGPLSRLVGSAWGAWALQQHHRLFTVIQIVVVLHILAIIGYAVVKRHNLVRPMVTGKKRMPAATRAPRMASPVLAAVLLAVSAALVWSAVNLL